MNLSFSPPQESRDVLGQEVAGHGTHGSAFSSSRSRDGCRPASDEVSGSLLENFQQTARWASHENSSASRGSGSNTSRFPRSNEKQHVDRASTAASLSFSSSVSLSESSAHRESTSKQPFCTTRSSYPLVFCNPVSDCENSEVADAKGDPLMKPERAFSMSGRNHPSSPTLFQPRISIDEASPDPSTSSTSEEMELDVERFDETQMMRNTGFSLGSITHQKCGVCGKLLSQKSPWCSNKIMRSGDMPAAGVLPCCHVYHVECLDQATPKAQIRDPPCPVCLKAVGAIEESLTVAEPLQLALRSLRRSRVVQGSESEINPANDDHRSHTRRRIWRWARIRCCLNTFSSSSPRHPT